MPQAEAPALSRSEWIVLSLVCEGPTHGNAVSHLVGPDGALGQIWRVPRGVVYRSLDRLSDLGLIRSAGAEPSPQGPVRLLVKATEAGQAAAVSWQHLPVQHTRDIRSELLVKLALLHRSGADPHDLLAAQHELLMPIASALRDRPRLLPQARSPWKGSRMPLTRRRSGGPSRAARCAPTSRSLEDKLGLCDQ